MEKKDIAAIQLTNSQETVLKQITNFINDPECRVFILKGYAGTGKTTLMRFLIKELRTKNKGYKLLASTGRAAKVLANLSGENVATSTIHSLIYSFKGLNKEYEVQDTKSDESGQLFLVFEPVSLDSSNNAPEIVYIVDEASMVSDFETNIVTQAMFGDGRLLKSLLEYDKRPGSKFIFVGDPCQLPPIEEYYSPALSKEYFQDTFGIKAREAQLTEIMRQGDTNSIITASKQIRSLYNNAPKDKYAYGRQRLWGHLPFRQSKDILLHPDEADMLNGYVQKVKKEGLNSAVYVCRSNSNCYKMSCEIRRRLGFSQSGIQKGELLMVVQNNLPTGLMNGDMVLVEEVNERRVSRAGFTFRPIKLKETFTGKTYSTLIIEEAIFQAQLNLDSAQQQALFVDFIKRMKERGIFQKDRDAFYKAMLEDPYLNALRCMYGYAITCHKAQGGEWEDVYMHVPRNITLNPTKETYQWVYTAMTRARDRLHVVDDFFFK